MGLQACCCCCSVPLLQLASSIRLSLARSPAAAAPASVARPLARSLIPRWPFGLPLGQTMASLLSQIFSCWSTPLAQAMSDDVVVPAHAALPKVPSSDAIYPASVIPSPKQPRHVVATPVSPPATRHTPAAPTAGAAATAGAAPVSAKPAVAPAATAPAGARTATSAGWDDWGDDDDDTAAPPSHHTPPSAAAVPSSFAAVDEREAPAPVLSPSPPAAGASSPSPPPPSSFEQDAAALPPITLSSFSAATSPYIPSGNGAQPHAEEDDDGDIAERALRKKGAELQVAAEPEPEIDYFADMAPTVKPAKRIVVESSPVAPKQTTRLETQSSQTLALAADTDDMVRALLYSHAPTHPRTHR